MGDNNWRNWKREQLLAHPEVQKKIEEEGPEWFEEMFPSGKKNKDGSVRRKKWHGKWEPLGGEYVDGKELEYEELVDLEAPLFGAMIVYGEVGEYRWPIMKRIEVIDGHRIEFDILCRPLLPVNCLKYMSEEPTKLQGCDARNCGVGGLIFLAALDMFNCFIMDRWLSNKKRYGTPHTRKIADEYAETFKGLPKYATCPYSEVSSAVWGKKSRKQQGLVLWFDKYRLGYRRDRFLFLQVSGIDPEPYMICRGDEEERLVVMENPPPVERTWEELVDHKRRVKTFLDELPMITPPMPIHYERRKSRKQ